MTVQRRWLELAVRCPAAGDRSALLAEGLLALGGRAAVERDGWFVTYFEEPDDPDRFVEEARVAVGHATGLDAIEVRVGWQLHEEWADTWKQGLAARRVTDRIVVRPTWIEASQEASAEIEIVLDPGMAFGTAEHGTTRGCLRLLQRALREGDHVLDVGSGSGILSVAAARLGAEHVVAIEGDTFACEALAENLERNGVAAKVRVVQEWATGESLVAHGPVDGVVANIETGVLLPLAGGLTGAIRPGGWLIVSGVLAEEWPDVEGAFVGLGLRRVDVDADGSWRSGRFSSPA